ncbi:MAG: hypothetical protein AVDCRST_MAG32-69 [uncultured Nocardioides sp.]|uniref:SGNH hydrolase-type esterase domain-containing protein n=1 Tax=uncultured Nocardioides sp. TaxID=198441 RepID=A0A6J4MQS3_9ACTN|nr:MAG: hypothetical protein AVDCRST_MAG32-69 [uncultured Nocardioides sp.]
MNGRVDVSAELERGAQRATKMLEERRRHRQLHQDKPPGVLVAEGDSWLSYPGTDVLDVLKDGYGWHVHSVADAGDNLESMAYDASQLRAVISTFLDLKRLDETPNALLLSGGGNDFAGAELAMLLDHRETDHGGINDVITTELVEGRMVEAWCNLLGFTRQVAIELFEKPVRTVIHGYAYPVPDGRGFAGGYGLLPGPWLAPSYARKGIGGRSEEGLQKRFEVTKELLDRYNVMLAWLVDQPGMGHVAYADLRETLSGPPDYESDWANELHPTPHGFTEVARVLHKKLTGAE